MNTTNTPNSDHNDTAVDDHPSITTILRYVAALLADVVNDHPEWAAETAHFRACQHCADVAAEHVGKLLWESPDWHLLEPGAFARRAQEVWITRLRSDARAPMREAAAQQLGALEPLSSAGVQALVEAAVGDTDPDVRSAAGDALRVAFRRDDLVSRVQLLEQS